MSLIRLLMWLVILVAIPFEAVDISHHFHGHYGFSGTFGLITIACGLFVLYQTRGQS